MYGKLRPAIEDKDFLGREPTEWEVWMLISYKFSKRKPHAMFTFRPKAIQAQPMVPKPPKWVAAPSF